MQEEPGGIHLSWLNVGAIRILESISSSGVQVEYAG